MKDINILIENGIDVKKSLELFGDLDTYNSMMEDFIKEFDGKLDSAKKYKDTSDMDNYAIIVHSLKSDCRYFGINKLADMFYEHELAGKRNDIYFVQENFNKLSEEAKRMLNVVKRYMGIITENVHPLPKIKTIIDTECIIVVDDSPIIRNFIEKIFNNKYKVILASDGSEAISIISNISHDKIMCMFLDLNMPGTDGFQVLEYFKSNELFDIIPVSIISGSDDVKTIERAFTYQIVDMIQKPFNELKIKNIAEKTIERKKF